MNKKGQGLYGMIVLAIFGLVWLTGLAPMLNNVGESSSATGILGFFVANLNLTIGFFYFLAWYLVLK